MVKRTLCVEAFSNFLHCMEIQIGKTNEAAITTANQLAQKDTAQVRYITSKRIRT